MIDRRAFFVTAAALAVTPLCGGAAQAAAPLRVASVKFGSLGWLLDTIKAQSLDKQAGVELKVMEVATNQAGPVALMAGEADVIVSDWTWAMRQRSLGEALRFAPYSSALGALMVAKDSSVRKLADLNGKRVGVAGSQIDKSWLLLRAYSKKTIGSDIGKMSEPIFATAPLVTEEMKSGRLDAVLNFWTYAARMSSEGYVPLVSMSDVLIALDIKPTPPLVGYVWKESLEKENGAALSAFLTAAAGGNRLLAESEAPWERLKPLIRPASDAELAAIRDYYRSGIPGPWTENETRSAEKLMAVLMEEGDTELLGAGTKFDPKLFYAAAT